MHFGIQGAGEYDQFEAPAVGGRPRNKTLHITVLEKPKPQETSTSNQPTNILGLMAKANTYSEKQIVSTSNHLVELTCTDRSQNRKGGGGGRVHMTYLDYI